MTDPNSKHGPIAFFLRYLPVCLAIIGAGVAIAPWPLLEVIKRNIAAAGFQNAGAFGYMDIRIGTFAGGPSITYRTFASVCGGIGGALLLAGVCVAIGRRRRWGSTSHADGKRG